MAIYDVLMLVILIGAVVLGAWRGMAWQLAPIASLILGGLAAYEFSEPITPWFGETRPMNHIVAMLVIYIVVSLGVYLVARSVRSMIEKFRMEHYDRHLGAILGGVKGLLLCLAVTFFLVALSAPARAHIRSSQSGYLAAVIMDALHPAMPKDVHDALEPYIHSLDDTVPSDKLQFSHHHEEDEDSDHDHDQAHVHTEEDDHSTESAQTEEESKLRSIFRLSVGRTRTKQR